LTSKYGHQSNAHGKEDIILRSQWVWTSNRSFIEYWLFGVMVWHGGQNLNNVATELWKFMQCMDNLGKMEGL